MTNCLLYARVCAGNKTKTRPSAASQFAAMKKIAKENGWDIIGRTIDRVEAIGCANDAKLKNLRHYFNEHSDIDAIIATVQSNLSLCDYAALRYILDRDHTDIDLIIVYADRLAASLNRAATN